MEGKGGYVREAPHNFQGPGSGDDQFMHSMIMKYANEEATKDGKPTGKFIFKRGHALTAAYEILETHAGLTGEKAQ